MLRMSFSFYRDQFVLYNLSDQLEDAQGRKVRFDKVRFLVSNIRILNLDGTLRKAFPGLVLSVDRSTGVNNTFQLGLMEEGMVGRVVFDLGLDDASNALTPTDHGQPPLNDQTLYAGSPWGFKFLELTGRWDSDNNNVVTAADAPVSYVTAGTSMRRARDLYVDLMHGQTGLTIPVRVRMDGIMNGISCSASPNTLGDGGVNVQLMNNLQAAVFIN